MKWLPLHIYQSDILITEVEMVESKFENMLKEIRCTESEEIQTNFLLFRDEIEQRVIDLDEFYQVNINDSRVGPFNKIKMRLQTLLDITIDGTWANQITLKDKTITNATKNKSSIKNDTPNSALIKAKNSALLRSNANLRASSLRQSSAALFGDKEANKWKELVFKIKLTENEYKLLLKEKSKEVLKI